MNQYKKGKWMLCYPKSIKHTKAYKKFFKEYCDMREKYGGQYMEKNSKIVNQFVREELFKINVKPIPIKCNNKCLYYLCCTHERDT